MAKKSRFEGLESLANGDPIVGEDNLNTDRKQALTQPKATKVEGADAPEESQTNSTTSTMSQSSIAINFSKTARLSEHHDELLDIYYALNKKSYRSKSELLYLIIEEFFNKKENRKYLELKNNK